MNILVKFPTFNRPEKFFNTLYEYYKKADNWKSMNFLISIDETDITMNNQAIKNGINTYPNIQLIIGNSKSKIDAINRDIQTCNYNWDILLLASDDMVPVVKGYDTIIRNHMIEHFTDLDGVLWYSDGHTHDTLNTLCILGREYYNRFNYIYYPEYKSVYADNEFTKVSKILGKYKYFDTTIIEHQHPDWGFGKNDIIHAQNCKNVNSDKDLYEERLAINFGIKI